MGLYKIGDRVIIRRDLDSLKGNIKFGLNESMIKMSGDTFTISKVIEKNYTPSRPHEDGCLYNLKEDENRFSWSSEAFSNPTAKPFFKTGDKVKIREDIYKHERCGRIPFCVNDTMASYAGLLTTIVRVVEKNYTASGELDGCKYILDIDDGQYAWACEDLVLVKAEDYSIAYFKIGDKVQIRPDLHECDSDEVMYGVADKMENYAGVTCTIERVIPHDYKISKFDQDGCRYTLKEDEGEFSWSSEMFIINNLKSNQNANQLQGKEIVVSRGDKREGRTVCCRRSKITVKRGHLSHKTVFGD